MRKTDWGRRAGNVKRTSIVLPETLWTRVKQRALHEKRNAQEIVADALEDYLRKARKGGA
jgi:metal-responsive CopG/Arc/MetJ family transcriptional regulator